MKIAPDLLKKILVSSHYVSEKDFDDAYASAQDLGRDIDDVLIFRNIITEEALGKLIADHLKVPYVPISHEVIKDEILTLVPEKIARSYRIVPFGREGNKLKLAMEDPTNFEALEFTRRHTNLEVEPYYATPDEIRKALGQYKKNIKEEFTKVIEESIKKVPTLTDDLSKAAENLPIIKILDTVLEFAVAERASDVHIESQLDSVIIRYRIDGVLRDIIKLPRGIEAGLVARIKILSNLKIDEHRIPQDGRYKFDIDEDVIALRISIIPGFYGENVVMRLLPESARPLSLNELGLTGINLDVVKANMYRPHGMLLVTGPTGSGKTSTLYSILNILNTVKVKICTIEDPIEYGIPRVNQIQVNPKAGMEFATGLRALLRHDPNIIMVGEIRDKETAQIAVNAALTGHLVLSTLHTNDAAGAIPRLLDMGVEGYLVASTTNAIIAQRLVRKICSACITEYSPPIAIWEKLAADGIKLTNQKFFKGKGCAECNFTGFMGRIGIFEVLSVSETIQKLLTQKIVSDQIRDVAVKEGMVTIMQDGLDKVASGLTTIEEVLKAVTEN
ncbi:Flp pilus assembly complex ATPase component TadA [Candidatus Woesebacteria bacterium]|nr:Flp pilus assembly complex ATPase component TadA [Candidatus Woesebacteria bacterium]QQG47939.1 MAG: Flp pilus assembly complex ATPase component TadA [Candidatus Woesebacteria bacterium]